VRKEKTTSSLEPPSLAYADAERGRGRGKEKREKEKEAFSPLLSFRLSKTPKTFLKRGEGR